MYLRNRECGVVFKSALVGVILLLVGSAAFAQDHAPKDLGLQALDAQKQGKLRQAIDRYTSALETGSGSSRIRSVLYNNRGTAYHDLGLYGLAIEDYDRAIALDPAFAAAFNNRGAVYPRLGRPRAAITDYDQAIAINPKFARAYANRANSYFYVRDFARAGADYGVSWRLGTIADFRIVVMKYVTLARIGGSDFTNLRTAAQKFELDRWPGVIVGLFAGMTSSDRVLKAVKQGNSAGRIKRSTIATFYLAQWHLLAGRRDRAAELFRRTVATGDANMFEFIAAQSELTALEKVANLVPAPRQAIAPDQSAAPDPKTDGLRGAAAAHAPTEQIFDVHLSSLRRADYAQRDWARLQAAYPNPLGDLTLSVRRKVIPGRGVFHRLLAGPFSKKGAAQQTCRTLRKSGQYCQVVRR